MAARYPSPPYSSAERSPRAQNERTEYPSPDTDFKQAFRAAHHSSKRTTSSRNTPYQLATPPTSPPSVSRGVKETYESLFSDVEEEQVYPVHSTPTRNVPYAASGGTAPYFGQQYGGQPHHLGCSYSHAAAVPNDNVFRTGSQFTPEVRAVLLYFGLRATSTDRFVLFCPIA